MNITFFIGNGFDLNLGLKTRYADFYPYFMQHAYEGNMIRNWLDGNERLWSDLEKKLGEELVKIGAGQLEKFHQDKEQLDLLLLEYLEKEQDRYFYVDLDAIKEEMVRSLSDMYAGLPQADRDRIEKTLNKDKVNALDYMFVTFNYTNCLDRIFEITGGADSVIGKSIMHDGYMCLGSVLHIHGTTEEEMILGVNDEEQIGNETLRSDGEFLDGFIKMRMNRGIGQQKTERVKEIIEDSRIVCIFGMSIGDTDKMWWEELINWLVLDEANILIVYWKGFEEELKRKLPRKVMQLNHEMRRRFFEKGRGQHEEEEFDHIKGRIMISFNADIFKFPRIN